MSLAIGTKVSFGRRNGEKTVGTIMSLQPSGKYKVRQDEARTSHRIGTIWTVPEDLLTVLLVGVHPATITPAAPAVKRPDSDIIADIARCYVMLSPENLSCDGELPRNQVQARATVLKAKLQRLFTELGRTIDELQAAFLLEHSLPITVLPNTPVKVPTQKPKMPGPPSAYQVGDRVQFRYKRATIMGTVTRVNATTYAVQEDRSPPGMKPWRVPKALPSLCAA